MINCNCLLAVIKPCNDSVKQLPVCYKCQHPLVLLNPWSPFNNYRRATEVKCDLLRSISFRDFSTTIFLLETLAPVCGDSCLDSAQPVLAGTEGGINTNHRKQLLTSGAHQQLLSWLERTVCPPYARAYFSNPPVVIALARKANHKNERRHRGAHSHSCCREM